MRAMRGLPSFRSETLYLAVRARGSPDAARRLSRRGVLRTGQPPASHRRGRRQRRSGARHEELLRPRESPLQRSVGRRRGKVWGDRYHRRDLTSPRQVRNALVYCLKNYKKHYRITSGAKPRIDLCSSARWFQGWTDIREHDDGPRPTATARRSSYAACGTRNTASSIQVKHRALRAERRDVAQRRRVASSRAKEGHEAIPPLKSVRASLAGVALCDYLTALRERSHVSTVRALQSDGCSKRTGARHRER